MDVLDQQFTSLNGAASYGAGSYGAGVYGGSGGNYVLLYPQPYDVVWQPDSVIVNTDSLSFTTAAVYLDIAQLQNLIGSTYQGNQDTINLPAVLLTANHRLIVVWFGGDANANATATLIGDEGTFNG